MATCDEEECECWDDWSVEHDDQGHRCVGPQDQVFQCNEEKPPLCVCKDKESGEEETLDLGALNCDDIKYESLFCGPAEEWDDYLGRNPQYRIQVDPVPPSED